MSASSPSADAIRAMFASAISDMYQAEAPQYRAMKALVAEVNGRCLANDPQLKRLTAQLLLRLKQSGEAASRKSPPDANKASVLE